MGRPPLNLTRTHLYLDPDDLARVTAIVGDKGVSKFMRDAMRQQLDRIAPGEEKAGPPYFEHDGGHEPRLSTSGRAMVLEIVRRRGIGFDTLQRDLSIADPIEFLHAVLGYRALPNRAVTALLKLLPPE